MKTVIIICLRSNTGEQLFGNLVLSLSIMNRLFVTQLKVYRTSFSRNQSIRFSETSLGVKMDELPNLGEYKNAIYKLGELFAYRLLRPWLRVSFIYKLSSVSIKMTEIVKILHDFSDNIIEQRKEYFDKIGTQSYSAKKRMALMDILLKAQREEGIDIDDEGIREEVDTFMFEVSSEQEHLHRVSSGGFRCLDKRCF